MTQKTSITKDLDEILEYLGINRTTAREAVHIAIKRLKESHIDSQIDAYLRSDPPKTNKGLEV
jgi:hypothetical protein